VDYTKHLRGPHVVRVFKNPAVGSIVVTAPKKCV